MHETLEWLGSFFPRYGVRLICLSAIFAIAGWICGMIATARPIARWLFWGAGVYFVLFILAAVFYAFRT